MCKRHEVVDEARGGTELRQTDPLFAHLPSAPSVWMVLVGQNRREKGLGAPHPPRFLSILPARRFCHIPACLSSTGPARKAGPPHFKVVLETRSPSPVCPRAFTGRFGLTQLPSPRGVEPSTPPPAAPLSHHTAALCSPLFFLSLSPPLSPASFTALLVPPSPLLRSPPPLAPLLRLPSPPFSLPPPPPLPSPALSSIPSFSFSCRCFRAWRRLAAGIRPPVAAAPRRLPGGGAPAPADGEGSAGERPAGLRVRDPASPEGRRPVSPGPAQLQRGTGVGPSPTPVTEGEMGRCRRKDSRLR